MSEEDLIVIRKALDEMGSALCDYNHVWSDELRGLYEQAIKITSFEVVAYGCEHCRKLVLTDEVPYHLLIDGKSGVVVIAFKLDDDDAKIKPALEFFHKHIDTKNLLGNHY